MLAQYVSFWSARTDNIFGGFVVKSVVHPAESVTRSHEFVLAAQGDPTPYKDT